MKHVIVACALAIVAALAAAGCGSESKTPEECPSFQDWQIYPPNGGPDTQFELFVLLKDKSANTRVEGIRADLFTSDGRGTGVAYDLVQSDSDGKRYLRSFAGSEVCEEGVCNVYFQVVATHEKGCIKGFDTDMFQVAYPGAGSDDDTDDDASDDDATDDDADDDADDDTAG